MFGGGGGRDERRRCRRQAELPGDGLSLEAPLMNGHVGLEQTRNIYQTYILLPLPFCWATACLKRASEPTNVCARTGRGTRREVIFSRPVCVLRQRGQLWILWRGKKKFCKLLCIRRIRAIKTKVHKLICLVLHRCSATQTHF